MGDPPTGGSPNLTHETTIPCANPGRMYRHLDHDGHADLMYRHSIRRRPHFRFHIAGFHIAGRAFDISPWRRGRWLIGVNDQTSLGDSHPIVARQRRAAHLVGG